MKWLPDAVVAAGAALIVGGIWMWSVPAALIVLGVVLCGAGYGLAEDERRRK